MINNFSGKVDMTATSNSTFTPAPTTNEMPYNAYMDINMDGINDKKDTIIRATTVVAMTGSAIAAIKSGAGFFGVIGYTILGGWLGAGLGVVITETMPKKF